jgi:hypothetical protein
MKKIELTCDSMRKNYACSHLAWNGKSVQANSLKHLILHVNFISSLLIVTILISSCATPHIQPTDTQLLFNSELLGFVKDGITTREEAILKLGIPSAQFEGEKILTYQLRVDQDGRWHLVAPQFNATTGLRQWREGTCSLVLIFDGEGVLRKHSLVEAK